MLFKRIASSPHRQLGFAAGPAGGIPPPVCSPAAALPEQVFRVSDASAVLVLAGARAWAAAVMTHAGRVGTEDKSSHFLEAYSVPGSAITVLLTLTNPSSSRMASTPPTLRPEKRKRCRLPRRGLRHSGACGPTPLPPSRVPRDQRAGSSPCAHCPLLKKVALLVVLF